MVVDLKIFYKPVLFFLVLVTLFCFTISCGKKAGVGSSLYETQDIKSQLEDGKKLYYSGKYDRAVDVCKEILKHDPGNEKAHYQLGLIYWKLGDMEKSADEFENVVSIDKTSHKAFYNLGAIYSSKGSLYSTQKAEYNFKRYLALNPNCANKKQIVDWLKSHGHKFDKTEPKIEIKKNDITSEAEDNMISQANMYVKQQKFDKAESLYQSVLEKNPRCSIASYKLGVMYLKQGQILNGRAEFLKTISVDPGFSKAFFNLGVLYSTQGETFDLEKAEFFFKKYLKIDPDAPQKEEIKAWLIKHETVNADRFSYIDNQAHGTTSESDDVPINFKSWLVDQSNKISNAKEKDE